MDQNIMCRASERANAPQVAFPQSIIGFIVDNVPVSVYRGRGGGQITHSHTPSRSPGNNKQLLHGRKKMKSKSTLSSFGCLVNNHRNYFFPARVTFKLGPPPLRM